MKIVRRFLALGWVLMLPPRAARPRPEPPCADRCQPMPFSERQDCGPSGRVTGRLDPNGKGGQVFDELVNPAGRDSTTTARHQQGIGHFERPVRRHADFFAALHPIEQRLSPWRRLVFEAPRQGSRCVDHEARHQYL